jgi:hypothetical protein
MTGFFCVILFVLFFVDCKAFQAFIEEIL